MTLNISLHFHQAKNHLVTFCGFIDGFTSNKVRVKLRQAYACAAKKSTQRQSGSEPAIKEENKTFAQQPENRNNFALAIINR